MGEWFRRHVEDFIIQGIGLVEDVATLNPAHGWAIGWSVAWNNTAKTLEMNEPPGILNWSIGNRGEAIDPKMPVFDGSVRDLLEPVTSESVGTPARPQSLYLEQLRERLGRVAVKNIGYE